MRDDGWQSEHVLVNPAPEARPHLRLGALETLRFQWEMGFLVGFGLELHLAQWSRGTRHWQGIFCSSLSSFALARPSHHPPGESQ